MNKPIVSIIVPAYNVEKYISKCLDSILIQTLKDIEIIVVNNGSTDSSGKFCDQYALKDNRIRVIHKDHGGLSSARNAGMEIAIGEYIGFVDSDDWVEVDMSIYRIVTERNCNELIFCKVSGIYLLILCYLMTFLNTTFNS